MLKLGYTLPNLANNCLHKSKMTETDKEIFDKADKGWICEKNFEQIDHSNCRFLEKHVNPDNNVNNTEKKFEQKT